MSASLSQLQSWMQDALVWSGRKTDADAIEREVLPSPTLTPRQRLAIYQRGYYERLLQCLEGQFKALRHALGHELFRDFAIEYLRTCPSQSPTLSDLGGRFATWLVEHRPDRDAAEKETWIDFMVDLVRYEWAVYLFFDKPGHEPHPLATAETPDADLVPQVSLELHRFDFPVAGYYHGVAAGEDPPIPDRAESHLGIVRKDYRIGILRVTAPQHEFLASLMNGHTLSAAVESLAHSRSVTVDEVATAWQKWKPGWCEAGFFGINEGHGLLHPQVTAACEVLKRT